MPAFGCLWLANTLPSEWRAYTSHTAMSWSVAVVSASTAIGRPSAIRRTGVWSVRMVWQLLRLPVLATLVVLEPLIRVALSIIATLGIVMTLFFEYVLHVDQFPFWLMLGISIGAATLLVPYYLLIRLFSITTADRS
jgi:hypothetical protein